MYYSAAAICLKMSPLTQHPNLQPLPALAMHDITMSFNNWKKTYPKRKKRVFGHKPSVLHKSGFP